MCYPCFLSDFGLGGERAKRRNSAFHFRDMADNMDSRDLTSSNSMATVGKKQR